MAAVSNDEKGEDALDWLMDNLVEDGDEIVAVRVIELDDGGQWIECRVFLTLTLASEKTSLQAQEEFREDAAELLKTILEKNDEFGGDRRVSNVPDGSARPDFVLQISVIVEFVAGRVTQTLMRLISLYRPDCEYYRKHVCHHLTKFRQLWSLAQRGNSPSSRPGAEHWVLPGWEACRDTALVTAPFRSLSFGTSVLWQRVAHN